MKPDYKAMWPVPLLAGAAGLLVAGLVYGISKAPKDDPAAPMEQVKEFMTAGEYDQAIATLNGKLIPPMQKGVLSPETQAEFFLLRARSLADGQSKLGLSFAENHKAIIADYDQAKKLKAEFSEADYSRMAASQLALGNTDAALEQARKLGEGSWSQRAAVLRGVAEHNLKRKDVRYEQTLAALSELETSPRSVAADRVWSLIRQAELRLAMDFHDEAITRLLRAIPMLEGVAPERRAELLRLLGKAYFEVGRVDEAMTQLEASLASMSPSDPGREETELLVGRLLQSQGRHEEAVQRLTQLVSGSGEGTQLGAGGPVMARARFTLAESVAAEGDDLEAARQYEAVVEAMRGKAPSREFSLATVGEALIARATDRATRDQHNTSLVYADLARKAYIAANAPVEKPKASAEPAGTGGHGDSGHGDGGHGAAAAGHGSEAAGHAPAAADAGGHGSSAHGAEPSHGASGHGAASSGHGGAETAPESAAPVGAFDKQGVPAAVYALSAAAHRKLAELTLAEARQSDSGLLRVDQISPATATEVKRHYLDAGADFREHARLMITVDPNASADSLWNAADCYDLAGDRDAAKDAFSSYATSAADSDQRKAEARYRLAQVLQAQGEPVAAAAQYRQVIESRLAGDTGGSGSGLFADRSLVPLARCLLDDKDPANDAEAEKLLRGVLSGTTFSPDAAEYRDALLELGEHLHRTARFVDAAGVLEEARKRYPDADEAIRVNFKLADCYRQSAAQIGEELRAALPQDRRDELLQLRQTRLEQAGELFAAVGRSISAIDARHLTQLDRVMQRNAAFYQADAAFDLGNDDAAIKLYDAAAQRYSADPASLLARVQIVTCYLRQNKPAEAAAANLRAKRQLAGIPPAAFDAPDMPMTRRHWERWLAADSQLQNTPESKRTTNAENGQ
jgi:tetratricopeptide (TPR) repeat protein